MTGKGYERKRRAEREVETLTPFSPSHSWSITPDDMTNTPEWGIENLKCQFQAVLSYTSGSFNACQTP